MRITRNFRKRDATGTNSTARNKITQWSSFNGSAKMRYHKNPTGIFSIIMNSAVEYRSFEVIK